AKAKQAQSRVKRLAKMADTEAVRAERALRIEFPEPAKLPHALLRVVDADCGYRAADGTQTAILHDVDFILQAGDRVALLGPNGAGKSTLVKTLVGELPLLSGERGGHPDLRIGYF
ncbi:ATP-binding cassette domain-containing protein, partial [Lysobacter sp. D1-1-M9]